MRYINLSRRRAGVSVLAAALAAGACSDIGVPDYNRAGTADLINNPNATLVNAASAGLFQNARRDAPGRVRLVGIVGKEGFYLDNNEPRYVTELVTGNIDPSSFAGNHNYSNPYGTIAQGQILLKAIDKVGANEYTAAQREALRGFALTMMGNDMLIIAKMHQFGPTEVNEDPLAPPAPMKTQAELFARARQYLDEAVPHLKAGGTSFTFPFPSGFTQFSAAGLANPSGGFLKFNRALRTHLDILLRDYPAARVHVDSSFITTASGSRTELNTGAYYTYGTGSGDTQNGLSAGVPEVADPRLKTDAQLQPGGARDQRFLLKVDSSGAVRTQLGISSNLRFTLYRTAPFFGAGGGASPVPIIRNEELILFRAEARWFTGDKPGAMADLNFVRQNSGGLAPIAQPATDDAFISALLYEYRYSTMYEDRMLYHYRRFNRLASLDNYPRAGDKAIAFFPVPFVECLARGGAGSAPGC
ncbi:MAG TPA: hypothetical protein VFS20_22020 [Longimicrobium sp.]|nr:hypothetical protein [Longimicrobium sp.]